MKLNNSGFWYRRLAKYIPCILPGIGDHGLPLANKYDVASVRDVFFSAHYWRMFEYLTSEPRLVVDLGAHCGHFSILCHLMLLERYHKDTAQYILVEPVASLVAQANKNLGASDMLGQAQVYRGLVGPRTGHGELHSTPQNLLASAVRESQSSQGNGETIPYLDLDKLIPGEKPIDILKIDIEGSEHRLLDEYTDVLARTKMLLIEFHGDEAVMKSSHERILEMGLKSVSIPIVRAAEVMRIYITSTV